MGEEAGAEAEEPREALGVGKVYDAVLLLLLAPDGPGLLGPLMALVAAVEEKPPGLEEGVTAWVLVCVAVRL